MNIALSRLLLVSFILLFFTGCATYGNINNQELDNAPAVNYSVAASVSDQRSNQVTVALAFSGGGSRAAALAYGVLSALRDSKINLNNQPRRLLDEVDAISSVSGGSFTAAYYGLYGDKIFSHFEDEFLRRNITGELVHGLFNPLLWFSRQGRTEMAVNYYEDRVFKGATFADLQRKDRPLIIINATDLGGGVRFSFLQEYFDLICSDLSSFPIARAVTASSAVPVLFNPVVVKNHKGCESQSLRWLESMRHFTAGSPQLTQVVDHLSSYVLKNERPFIHLVDGGITDNLGLRAIYEMVEISGGARRFLDAIGVNTAPHLLVISVNASTEPQYGIESSNKIPSMDATINAVTDIQLHQDNIATIEKFQEGIKPRILS